MMIDASTWPVGVAPGANGISCWRCELILIDLVGMHERSFELAELASVIEDHIPECMGASVALHMDEHNGQ